MNPLYILNCPGSCLPRKNEMRHRDEIEFGRKDTAFFLIANKKRFFFCFFLSTKKEKGFYSKPISIPVF